MLKLRYLFENYDLAKAILSNWSHDADNLDEMLSRFRISSNAVYPYTDCGNVCFLRFAPVTEKNGENIRAELEFLGYLRDNGYQANEPIPANNGELLLTVSTSFGDYYACAFKCVAGEQLEDVAPDADVMYKYGEMLARLHKLSQSYTPTVRRWSYADALSWCDAAMREVGAPDKMLAESADIRKELDALPKSESDYGLVHYDFELDNVFCDEKTGEFSVIDFDDSMYNFYALDLEQALDSIAEEYPEDAMEMSQTAFMNGYRSLLPFDARMDGLRSLMRRFINIYAYARISRALTDTFTDSPDWMDFLRSKLERRVSQIESSVK